MPAHKDKQPTRREAQIEADLNATRERLTSSVESLIDQVHPNRIKQRQVARVKALAATYQEKARSQVFNARGDLRTNRLAAVGGALAGLVAFVLVVRGIARRRRA